MLTQDWQLIKNFEPTEFDNPEKMELSIVGALDRLVSILNIKPVILSDYRPFNPDKPNSQHAYGKAIDVTWPDADSVSIYDKAVNSGLFGGVGVYVNEKGYVSFHLDSRPKKADGSIATWGGVITRPSGQKKIEYTGASVVLNMIPKIALSLPIVVLIGWLVWSFIKK